MDKFFTQKTCDRCNGNLDGGRTMSAFSEECICLICSDAEKKDSEYQKAVDADVEQIRQGNFNYKGIRGDK